MVRSPATSGSAPESIVSDTVTHVNRPERLFLVANGYATSGATYENDSIQSDLENLAGGRSHAYLLGSAGANFLFGGPGDDYIYGIGGNDYLLGEDGNDQLVGGEGNDVMFGGDGSDFIDARDSGGADIVWGDGGPGIVNGFDQAWMNNGDRANGIELLSYY